MNFKLNVTGGKVRYLNRTNGAVVGSDTPIESAMWLLKRGKPEKSDEFPGFPIAVKVQNSEYFFSGEWLMGGAEDVLTEEPEKPEQSASTTPRKRRTKDKVCSNDYCDLEG